MDSAPKALVDIASVSRRVFDTLFKYAGHKTLEKIVVASGTILEALNNALILGSGTVDDRLLDWLNSEEPRMCLDILNRMETLLRPKLDSGYGVNRLFQTSRSLHTKDRSNEALRHFWRHKGYFHFLLSTEIWNRESGTQQQALGVPPNTLHMHEAVAKQDVTQVTQHKSRDPSSVAQEKKPRKQRVDTKKPNNIVRRLGAWSCKDIHDRTILLRQPDTCMWLPNTNAYMMYRNTENMENTFLWLHGKAAVPCVSGDYVVPLTRFLIREGASVNVAASNGDTPLHLALTHTSTTDHEYRHLNPNRQMGSWKLVEILLNSGDVGGQTPLDLAKEKGHFFEQNFLRLVGNSHAHRSRS